MREYIITIDRGEGGILIETKVSPETVVEVMGILLSMKREDHREITGTAIDDIEEVLVKKKKPGNKKRSDGRLAPSCGVCGEYGHNKATCPKNKDQVERVREQENTNELDITEELIDEINDMLSEGKGSREIAEHYDVPVKEANRAIAKAKGITLPR